MINEDTMKTVDEQKIGKKMETDSDRKDGKIFYKK